MNKEHTKETLNFNGFTGYYGSVPQGYGGFDYSDVDYLNRSDWKHLHKNWCDTGYQNVIHGHGEAITFGVNGGSSYGLFETPNLHPLETFTMKSMIGASAWETDQLFEFKSYTYTKGGGFVIKADDSVYLSQIAQTIDFATIGKPADFQHIAALLIVSESGQYGNTCSYGANSYTTGNQLAMDNVKVAWDGTIPKGHEGVLVTKGLSVHPPLRHPHVAPNLVPNLVQPGHHEGAANGHPAALGPHAENNGYHAGPMSSFAAADPAVQFHLPAVEHFGL
jgi:hypothetical protein